MKQIAILGSTASGKTALSIFLAKKHNCIILSLDSLSVYKEINIASAKPSKQEQDGILHFGIDEIYPNESFSVVLFFEIYKKAQEFAKKNNKNLIIVGGTSFYLKAMMSSFSKKPIIKEEIIKEVQDLLLDINKTYEFIEKQDPKFALKISKNDKYRIEKWLELYLSTKQIPSVFLQENQQKPIIKNIKIFEIITEKQTLEKRIKQRTSQMLKQGLIDEVFMLEKKYTRAIKPLSAIGLKETLEYFDAKINLKELEEKISQNTIYLAKRQKTFNKTQFLSTSKASLEDLKMQISSFYES